MSMSVATLRTRVKTRIRIDKATPAVNDLHDNSITTIADEKAPLIIDQLDNPYHMRGLHVLNTALVGSAIVNDYKPFAVPSNYHKPIAVLATGATASRRKCRIMETKEFNIHDSSSFVTTPVENWPLCNITDYVKIKPNTITSAVIDYIKVHPTIASNSTGFDEFADHLLVLLVLMEYYQSIPRDDLVLKTQAEYDKLVKEDNAKYGNK